MDCITKPKYAPGLDFPTLERFYNHMNELSMEEAQALKVKIPQRRYVELNEVYSHRFTSKTNLTETMKLLFSFLLHRKSWLLVLMVTFILLWSAFIVFQSDDFYKLERNWYLKPAPCRLPDEKLRDMAELTLLMSSVLDKLQIPHVLCFGTLWGALRNGAILPWDNNVDICIMYKDMMGTSTEELVNSFNYNGAQAAYISKHGLFEIHYKNAVGYINVFANSYGENMYQIGWGRWSFYSKVQRLVLPSRFMEAPFPKAKFYNKMLPVPHEDIEMLKYLYPNDWWLVSKPPGC